MLSINKASFLSITFLSFLAIYACKDASVADMKRGQELAKIHCISCHDFPDPDLVDQTTWEQYILPRMGYMLGIGINDSVKEVLFEKGSGGQHVREAGVFPKQPLLEEKEWQAIKAYFLHNAPESLPYPALAPITDSLSLFEPKLPQLRMNPPSTTLLKVEENGGLLLGDAHTQSMLSLDTKLNLEKAAKLKEGLVHSIQEKDFLYLTLMGSFSPTDADTGMFIFLPLNEQGKPEIIIPNLRRPVHSKLADLDGDGAKDIIICEFGKWTGELAWWKNKGAEGLEKKVLRAKAGATRIEVLENEEGLPDLLALFGQGDEGLFYYKNLGEGNFEEQKVISFPSSYGMSAMELVDWNQDGAMDVILCSGDNADYPAIVKPYHGIYLYLNDGENNFTQAWFQALPGAYGTRTGDFDQDRDLDIAVISFFPDYDAELPRAFVYLENVGKDEFKVSTFKDAEKLGRWIVLDSGDIDKDGDEDIVLGSLAFEVRGDAARVEYWAENGIPFVVLENQLK